MLSAHLDLICREGKPWVSLRLLPGHRQEGDAQRDQEDQHRAGARRRGPGYYRRLERRAAQRERVAADHARGGAENVRQVQADAEHAMADPVDVAEQVADGAMEASVMPVGAVNPGYVDKLKTKLWMQM